LFLKSFCAHLGGVACARRCAKFLTSYRPQGRLRRAQAGLFCMPHPMPNTSGTGGTRGTLWHGVTNLGGTWSFGAQRAGFPFRGDQSPSFTARPCAWFVGRAGRAGGLAAWVSAHGFLPTGCRSLVRGIRLVLLWAGDIDGILAEG
jgi:hypothetical protein